VQSAQRHGRSTGLEHRRYIVSAADGDEAETYNPWTVVNLVFAHLADEGLHPTLGESGDPGPPAQALLLALGIQPTAEGNRQVIRNMRAQLAEIRAVMLEEESDGQDV
jgi:hypothetical protein